MDEIRETPGVVGDDLDEVEDRIAEYEAKKAWYEARLVELNSRRVRLYRDLTGSAPAFVYSGSGRPLGVSLEEIERLSAELVRAARQLHDRTRKLVGQAGPSAVQRSDRPDSAREESGGINARTLLNMLAGSDEDEEASQGPDFRQLALQLLPRLIADRDDN